MVSTLAPMPATIRTSRMETVVQATAKLSEAGNVLAAALKKETSALRSAATELTWANFSATMETQSLEMVALLLA